MKSKWLRFLLLEQGKKTNIWRVENTKGEKIGLVKWYSQWRQYCFLNNTGNMVYAQSCLKDIANFIKEQMNKRKIRKVRAKSISKVSRKEARRAVGKK